MAEVYRDDKRLNVTVVRYGKRENKQALVEIADPDHPWNQRIFLTSVQDVSRRAGTVENTYFIQLDGKPWGLVFNQLDGGGLALNLRENGDTGKNVRYPLYYSKELSSDTNSEFLLTAYLKQQSDPKTSTSKYNGKLVSAQPMAGGGVVGGSYSRRGLVWARWQVGVVNAGLVEVKAAPAQYK